MVDYPSQCTILVCEGFSCTSNVLSAINRGIPIVTPAWLLESHKQKRFIDEKPYRLQDAKKEYCLRFSLEDALGKYPNEF